MADVTIHHCRLRVVRRGGWAWGEEPRQLLQSAIRALPDLIARKLANLWPDDVELEISAPVRIRIPVRLSEMIAAISAQSGDPFSIDESSHAALSGRIEAAIKTAFECERLIEHEPTGADDFTPEASPDETSGDLPDSEPGRALLRVLLSWRKQGVLAERLELFSLTSLEAWLRTLLDSGGHLQVLLRQVSPGEIARLMPETTDSPPHPVADRTAAIRRWLILASEATAQFLATPRDMTAEELLKRTSPLDSVAKDEKSYPFVPHVERKAEAVSDQQQTALDAMPQRAASSSGRRRAPAPQLHLEGELQVCSALPFLLLGPLARLGYLDTLDACLEAAELEQQAPKLAVALAYKVLDPPERGWRRSTQAATAAAAFAGLAQSPPSAELAEFARRIQEHLSPLDAVIAGTLIEGHNREQPLMLFRAETGEGKGLLLVDVEGIFPIAWADEPHGLLQSLGRCRDSILLIPQSAADPDLLRILSESGFSFVTDAPPTRKERWRALRFRSSDRFWTNDRAASDSLLIKSARQLAQAAERTQALWQSLAAERRSIPLASNDALDRSLSLAAALALGTIAWTLWREREPVAPQLALERFHDLDARVRFSPAEIRVRLPLGRRYSDLYAHGLLNDVKGVPWLKGRVVQFSGG